MVENRLVRMVREKKQRAKAKAEKESADRGRTNRLIVNGDAEKSGQLRGGNGINASMTTQEKTTAIKNIIAIHQDNVTAAQNARVGAGLNPYVIEAMNAAFKNDLVVIFSSLKPAGSDAG
jgi:hypothetical protein